MTDGQTPDTAGWASDPDRPAPPWLSRARSGPAGHRGAKARNGHRLDEHPNLDPRRHPSGAAPPANRTSKPAAASPVADAVAGQVAEMVARLRSRVREEVAERVALAEADAGAVLGQQERQRLAEEVIASHLERQALADMSARRAVATPVVEQRVRRGLLDGLFGLGGLQPLLDDPDIETIIINGCDRVWVRYADGRRARVAAVADSDAELIELVRQAAARSGTGERRFDPGAPILDLQLPDRSRLHAIMAVSRRPAVSIRRHRHRRVTLEDLRRLGMVDDVVAAVLVAAVRARFNIIIAGGQAVGKTTLLIALAAEIDPLEHLVTIEDTFELGLDENEERHPVVTPLQAREPNNEGEGEVPIPRLVRAGLRQAADRVIVGEIRGPEVVSVFNVMTQGNDGSMATVHASSTAGVFPKLAAYAAQSVERLSMESTALLTAAAVDLVVHLDISPDGCRVVSGIREVLDADGRDVISNEIFAPGPDRRARLAAPARAATVERLVAAGLDPAMLHPDAQRWSRP